MTELHTPAGESSVTAMLRRELAEARTDLEDASERVRLLEVALAAVSSSAARTGGLRQPEPSWQPEAPSSEWKPEAPSSLGRSRAERRPVNGATPSPDMTLPRTRPPARPDTPLELHAPIGGRAGEPPLRGAVYVDRAPARSEPAQEQAWSADKGVASFGGYPAGPRSDGVPPAVQDDRRRSHDMPADKRGASFELRDPGRWSYENALRPEGELHNGVGHEHDSTYDGDVS